MSSDNKNWKADGESDGDWGSESGEEEEEESSEEEEDDDEEDEESEEDEDDEDEDDDDDEDSEGEDNSEEEGDKDDDDFADEPAGDDSKFGAAAEQFPYQDEPDEDAEEKREEARAKRRKALLACSLCFLCLLVVGGAVVLGVIVTAGGGNSSSPPPPPAAPTESPTPAPVPTFVFPTRAPIVTTKYPTEFPTISPGPTIPPSKAPTVKPTPAPSSNPTSSSAPTEPVPDELVILPDEDTYIYVDGFTVAEAYGKEDSLLVQNGPKAVNEVPDAYILITFDLEEIPQPWRIVDRENHAILRLTHIPRTNTGSSDPQTYTVSRLPSTPLAVETLHGLLFVPFEPIAGPSFSVNPGSQKVEVDITSLLFDQPPFVPITRHGRDLQGPGTQLFLMIDAQGPEQPDGGDRFHSRESDFSPELYIGLFQPGFPRPTKAPSLDPASISQPSVQGPTTSSPSAATPAAEGGPTTSSPSATTPAAEGTGV